MLAVPYERQAEQFTYGVLVDEAEVQAERLRDARRSSGLFRGTNARTLGARPRGVGAGTVVLSEMYTR